MRRDLTAYEALAKVCAMDDIETVLDVGSGAGLHAEAMRLAGKTVTTNSLEPPADLIGDFLDLGETEKFDCIWAAHVLEHQPNPNLFLTKCFRLLRDDGVLAITVPPFKKEIVGGHLTVWNGGLLLYNVILAGFDCGEARLKKYGYNISLIVRKRAYNRPTLRMDKGDIAALAPFFPFQARQGFNGEINEVNWV